MNEAYEGPQGDDTQEGTPENPENQETRETGEGTTQPPSDASEGGGQDQSTADAPQETIRVLLINNEGGGFADYINVPKGTTAEGLFAKQIGEGADPDNYMIRINREFCSSSQTLNEGDRISMTPKKIEGALLLAA